MKSIREDNTGYVKRTMTNQIYIHPWKYARWETCKISKYRNE